MNRRGFALPTTDILLSLFILGLFAFSALYLTDVKRQSQEEQVLSTLQISAASHALLTFMRTPFSSSTVGEHITQALIDGDEPFSDDMRLLGHDMLDPMFDTPSTSWFIDVERFYPGEDGRYATFRTDSAIHGSNAYEGAAVCVRSQRPVAQVVLPVTDGDVKASLTEKPFQIDEHQLLSTHSVYVVRLWRCFA